MLILTLTLMSQFGLPDPNDNVLEEHYIESERLFVRNVLETRFMHTRMTKL